MEDLKNILESLLFVAEEPLGLERLRKVLPQAESGELRQALGELQADYEARSGGFYLAEVAGGFQFRTRPVYTQWIRRLVDPKPLRLSKAALETLAIIAYKQPVIRADIEHIRGVDCGGVLRQLLERKLIRVLGRREIAGRPLIYATTKRFLETFDLKDLKDLPTPKEIEEFGKAPLEERGNIMIEPDEEVAAAAQPIDTPVIEGPADPHPDEDLTAEAPDPTAGQEIVNALPAQEPEPEKKLDFDSGTT